MTPLGCDETMITDVLCLGSSEDVKLICELSATGTHSIVNVKKFMGKSQVSLFSLGMKLSLGLFR